MNIERINTVLSKAIVNLQESELDGLVEGVKFKVKSPGDFGMDSMHNIRKKSVVYQPPPKFEHGDEVTTKGDFKKGRIWIVWSKTVYDDYIKDWNYKIMDPKNRGQITVPEKSLTLVLHPSLEKRDSRKWSKGRIKYKVTDWRNPDDERIVKAQSGYIRGMWGVFKPKGLGLGWMIVHLPSEEVIVFPSDKKVFATKALDSMILEDPSLLTQRNIPVGPSSKFYRSLLVALQKERRKG